MDRAPMKNHGSLGPTCVLKVDLQCCKACPLKLKKKLMQISGVNSIHIDTKQGLVTVSGVADASTLLKAIEKVGKKAELCKFEMQPKHPKLKETRFCTKGKHKNSHSSDDGNHLRPLHTAMHGPAAYFPGPVPPRPYEGIPPMVYRRTPPWAYNYYEPHPPPLPPTYRDGPVGSSLVHTYNDLNVHGCTIL